MRAPAHAFPNPLRPDQVRELLDPIEVLAAQWRISPLSLRKAVRGALMDMGS